MIFVPAITTVLLIVIMCAICYYYERKTWNHGICKTSGKPWQHFGTDSQHGRSYKDGEGNYCRISWLKVDR